MESEIDGKAIGQEINGPGRTYFDDVVVDNIMDALLELSASVWTYRDRLFILEKVLAEQGTDVTKLIESYRPSAEDNNQRREERQAFVNRVFLSFNRRPQ